MNLRHLSVILVVMLSVAAIAQRRSTSEALRIAVQHSSNAVSAHRMMPQYATLAAESEAWMAVNTGSGYVLVGADERQPQVLGYSDSGSFNPDSINDNLRYWLQCYDNELRCELNPRGDMLPVPETMAQKTALFGEYPAAVEPLCPTKWNQNTPYNLLCPYYSGTTHAATGCVATAMAQVMATYQYPATGSGAHSYRWARAEGDTITLSAQFDSINYDWSVLTGPQTLSTYVAFKNNVSALMYQCGVSVDMKYGASSSANTTTAARSLVSYFGYDQGIQNIQANVLPADSVPALLYLELAAGRPVVYAGTSEQNTRHAFICDGYNSGGFFHINWGWGGNSDGYYLLSALTPSGQQGSGSGGKTYGKNHTLLIGIAPSAANKLPPPHMGIDSLTVDTTAYANGKSFLGGLFDLSPTIRVNMVRVQNFGLNIFKGEYGLALLDTNSNNIIKVLDSRALTLRSGYFRTGTNRNLHEVFSFKASAINEGVYRLAHVYKDSIETTWRISYARYSPSFLYITVSADSVLLSYDAPQAAVDTSSTPTGISYLQTSAMVCPTVLSVGDLLTIRGEQPGQGTVTVEIFDLSGNMLLRSEHRSADINVRCPDMAGVYIVRTASDHYVAETKIIVR